MTQFSSRKEETAIIVYPLAGGQKTSRDDETEGMEEAIGLAAAIGLRVADRFAFPVPRITPGLYLGKGQAERVAAAVEALKPDVVFVNASLSPVQQRNLERQWNAKVIDRTGLILEIFGARAQTREGRLQVELAALNYQRSRLVRSWTHLERQRGGAGFMGGPGERQIELDRRMLDERMLALRKQLQHVRRTRHLARKSRERVPFPVIALVGYTNAGKSTIFNRLTGAEVLAQDLLFATLDPTSRRVRLPNGQDAIITDTVGFIADLPTHLIEAFRATLEQVAYADVIAHVIDVSRPDHQRQRLDVITVLAELGIDYATDRRVIEVWNKIDRLNPEDIADLRREAAFAQDRAVCVSALTGEGMEPMLGLAAEIATHQRLPVTVSIPVADGRAQAWLHAHGEILSQEIVDSYANITVQLDPKSIGQFLESFSYGLEPADLI